MTTSPASDDADLPAAPLPLGLEQALPLLDVTTKSTTKVVVSRGKAAHLRLVLEPDDRPAAGMAYAMCGQRLGSRFLGNATAGGIVREPKLLDDEYELEVAGQRYPVALRATKQVDASAPDVVRLPAAAAATEGAVFVGLRLCDDEGLPLIGVGIAFLVAGVEHVVSTDADGVARQEAPTGASLSVRLPVDGALRAALRPWSALADRHHTHAPDAWYELGGGAAPALEPPPGTVLTLGVRAWRRVAELPGLHFDFDRSFLRPDALADVRHIAATALEHPERRLSVFGHTDTVGDATYNKTLSERRARIVHGALTHDVEAWEAAYVREGWGTREVQRMLNAVDGAGLAEDGKDGPGTQAAVKAFQVRSGLASDGKAGRATRKALFKAYLARGAPAPVPAARIASIGGSPFMGCGEMNPVVLGRDETSRRVVVFLHDPVATPPDLPCRIGSIAPCEANRRARDPAGSCCEPLPLGACAVYRRLVANAPALRMPRLRRAAVEVAESLAPAGASGLAELAGLAGGQGGGTSLGVKASDTNAAGGFLGKKYSGLLGRLEIEDAKLPGLQDHGFMELVVTHLLWIADTPSGNRLLTQLDAALAACKGHIEIVMSPSAQSANSVKDAHDGVEGYLKTHIADGKLVAKGRGKGCGSTISYHPFRDKLGTTEGKPDAPWRHVPAPVLLAHELIHALHLALGRFVFKTDRAKDPEADVKTEVEELRTVGLSDFDVSPGEPDENQLRADWYTRRPEDKAYYPKSGEQLPRRTGYV